MRARQSPLRASAEACAASSRSTRSPVVWPKRSLICLNRSTSARSSAKRGSASPARRLSPPPPPPPAPPVAHGSSEPPPVPPPRGGGVAGAGAARPPVRQAGQRVLVSHRALVALGLHEPRLEELDRRAQADVGHGVAQRAGGEQVVAARRGDERRGVAAHLDRAEEPG